MILMYTTSRVVELSDDVGLEDVLAQAAIRP
jgi:hypothetical protein